MEWVVFWCSLLYLDGNMNTSGRDRGIRQGTVAMKSSRRQQGQWIWTESSESSDWQVIFRHCAFPRPKFDFKGRKFLVICSPMQKKMSRNGWSSGWRRKGRDYRTSSFYFLYWCETSLDMRRWQWMGILAQPEYEWLVWTGGFNTRQR